MYINTRVLKNVCTKSAKPQIFITVRETDKTDQTHYSCMHFVFRAVASTTIKRRPLNRKKKNP